MAETQEAKWYIVHTYSGYEDKVMNDLKTVAENRGMRDLILGTDVPVQKVTRIKEDGSEKQVVKKIFPGYVFVKMIVTDDSWYVVRNTRGVTGFVGPASKPVPLTKSEVAAIGLEKREAEEVKQTVELAFAVGDSVKIIDGPLKDYTGIITELDSAKKTAKITISLLGREVPADVALSQLAAADY